MLFIIIIGFIIPWIPGIYLYKKAPKIFFTTAPITALIAVTINQLGIHMGLWKVHPMPRVVLLDSIFLDLGIFPVVGALFTYFVYYKAYNRYLIHFLFIGGMTAIEYVALLTGTVSYDDEWNILLTLLIYLGGFITIDLVSRKLVKLNVYPVRK
ncbi:hypothetical protein MUN89_08625 [Halobacillus salinarum]|uniref:Uncharacterized protein n=1 Tax=Halobacillus salinarum TaxID=2932257 RepID=A0ABY4EPN6_9BACI|nr:CBO0543 family protein [Halobacillus salinarum]UOQ46419.1 hypothetical protein MUN89_08625 [Halobacillus salinarum]